MKTKKIIYWISTGVFSLMMLNSAYQYLTAAEMEAAFQHLGFPEYFRIELGIAKLLGALVLLVPKISREIKQFAYAGFSINLISGFIAHYSKGDATLYILLPFIFFGILVISYIYYDKIHSIIKK